MHEKQEGTTFVDKECSRVEVYKGIINYNKECTLLVNKERAQLSEGIALH